MQFGSMLNGSPRRPVSMVEAPDLEGSGTAPNGLPSFLNMGQEQPDRPTYGQAFRAGFDQTQGDMRRKLLGGLAGYAGGGGFGGAVGNVAKFLL